MPSERFRHLYIDGPDQTAGFTSAQSGGSSANVPPRDRRTHGALLTRRFEAAWQQSEAGRAVSHVTRHGVYLEFESEPGHDLAVKSLEDLRSAVQTRVLNVRTRKVNGKTQTLATVFVPDERRASFLRKLNRYLEEDTPTGKPKNERLVNSISDIRSAVLKSFWRESETDRIPTDSPEPVEVWIRAEADDAIPTFTQILRDLHIDADEGVLRFPERAVMLVHVTRSELEKLVESSDHIAEFRLPSMVATEILKLTNAEQTAQVRGLLDRTSFDSSTDVAVCLLDTGVNNGHALLAPVLDGSDLHAYRLEWGTDDHDGHGTLMAGTAAYDNLLEALKPGDPLVVEHVLESAKILPPREANPKRLWGHITTQSVSRAEIQAPARRRVVCMATTCWEDRERGHPSSWSGAIDELTSGYSDDVRRLFIVSAGNTDPAGWSDYPAANLTDGVHDPAQAWNALVVGAFTKLAIITDPNLADYAPVAPAEGLSPHSTTSLSWPDARWPIKPEVLFEGGNAAKAPDGFVTTTDELKIISTSRDPQVSQFEPFHQTSAAAAQAACMAARLQVLYRDAWPETIRGAIVHSAEWTDAMRQQFLADESKASYARLVRICGYGVPDLDRAAYCFRDSLTLVSESEIQPFGMRDGRVATQDMHLYRLPWPREVLSSLGEADVEMRVTLSYFVEPSPGEIGWEDRYRYASHGLRFDVNGPGESEGEFVSRINRQARDDGEHPGTTGASAFWTIGQARNVGSVHSDCWRGSAANLAASNIFAVYPTIGWWRERKHLERLTRKTRYALIVSVRTPLQDVDIYTPVAAQIGIKVPVSV